MIPLGRVGRRCGHCVAMMVVCGGGPERRVGSAGAGGNGVCVVPSPTAQVGAANMEALGKGRDISLSALQQNDPFISSIVDVTSQVALYNFNPKSSEWVSCCRRRGGGDELELRLSPTCAPAG